MSLSDKLEKAGYKHVVSKANPFVRYADDFIVMTKTKEELPATLTFVKEPPNESIGGWIEIERGQNQADQSPFSRGQA